MSTISASDARQTLPALLDRVAQGEEVEIARHGHVVAVLVSPTTLATRRAPATWRAADEVAALLQASRDRALQPAALEPDRVDDLVEAAREGRFRE